MKAYIVATILLSSVLLNFVDTDFDSYKDTEFTLDSDSLQCGKQTFSSNVKSAFVKESDLNQYSPSEIYLSKTWVVVLNSPYCTQHISNSLIASKVENIREFPILSGTWILEFQTGDIAFMYLKDLYNTGYLWTYYPLVEKEVNLRFEPNDENLTKQWYIDNSGQNNGTNGIDINVKGVWNEYTGDGIVIGVVDSGLDYTHPDISPNYEGSYSYDFCDSDTDPMTEHSSEWHGTAIAGIAAAKGNNDIGIAGVSYNSTLAGIRLFCEDSEDDYTFTDLEVSQALTYKNQNIDIYSNSWGPEDDGQTLGRVGPLTLAAFEAGVNEGRGGLGSIYVWSNGNGLQNKDYSNKDGYANSRYTIAVGAVNWQGKQTGYSEHGPNILTSAPSHNGTITEAGVYTTDIVGDSGDFDGNYTVVTGGTSTAAPMVSGVIALMLEANSDLTWRDVQHILVRSSKKVDSVHPGWFKTEVNRDYNNAYGYGLLDANTAVNLAKNWNNIEEEVKTSTDKVEVNKIILDDNNEGVTSTYFMHHSINIE